MIRKIIVMIFLLMVCSACATTPTAPTAATPAPSERILAFQEKTPTSTAFLIVTRDEGFLGGGCFYSLYINKVLAARLDVAERVNFFLNPGEILLRVGRDPYGSGLCGVGQDSWTQRETTLRSGEIKYFRLLIDENGMPDIQRAEW